MQRQGATEGGAAEESSSSSDCVLVVEGSTLDFALQEELRSDFLELSGRCRVVLCCRSTPLQKSQVVQLLREQLGVMTLAVGRTPLHCVEEEGTYTYCHEGCTDSNISSSIGERHRY